MRYSLMRLWNIRLSLVVLLVLFFCGVKPAFASFPPLRNVQAWVVGNTVYFKVYDPLKGTWEQSNEGDHGSVSNLLNVDGVVAWKTYGVSGGVGSDMVHFAVYDPLNGGWRHDKSESYSSVSNLLNVDGVVAWKTGVGSAMVHFTVYDPLNGGWRHDKSESYSTSVSNLLNVNGVVTWVVGNNHYTRGYDPGRSSWYDGYPKPGASFNASPLSGNPPLWVWFWDMTIGATSWSWNFGDGGTSAERSPSHTFSSVGIYTVMLSVGGPGGNQSISKNITVGSSPSEPTLAFPTNGGTGISTSPTLSWSASSSATSYTLQVSTDNSFSSYVYNQLVGNVTSQQISGLSSGTTYYWRVNASNAVGTSGWSGTWSFTTSVSAPSSPTLSSPANGSTGISTSPTLSWNSVSGATSYILQVSQNSDLSSPVYNQSVGNVTSQQISGLLSGTTYYWRVNSSNTGGTSGWSPTWNFATLITAPALISPVNNSTGISTSPTLRWTASPGATSYTLQVSQNNDLSNPVFNQSVNDTSKQLSGLSGGIAYYWRVNASNSGGSSGWTSPWNFTTIVSSFHFRVANTSTGSNSTVMIPTSAIITIAGSSFSLDADDEIAVYSPTPDTMCCGLGKWNESNLSITVWGDNDQTSTVKEGFTSGQAYRFHLWDVSASKEYRNFSSANFSSGNSTYSTNGISVVSRLTFATSDTLVINLSSGWSMISSNVRPDDADMSSIFNRIVSNVVIVKNILGKVYWPEYGVNQIGNWNIVDGYQIYMSNAATLTIQGQRVNPSTPISLPTGWSMIAYLPNVALSPATALASLGDKVVIMKDVSGKVYWPRYSIDQIGTMQVGKGYQIYLSGAGTLIYPASVSKEGNSLIAENWNRGQMSPQHFAYVRGTGSNATILMRMIEKPIISGTVLEVGDEIGIYTPEGICAGAGVWNGDDIVITVWGDNGETMNIDGFTEGQSYNFKLWDKNTNIEKDISVIAESGNLSYSDNGITVISYEKSSAIPDNFVLKQNYPNPFNPSTRIEYQIKEQSEVTLAIYNTAGQLICLLVQSAQPAGVHSVEWDGKNSSGIQVPSGIYLYRLQAGSIIETRKMVMMK